MGLHSCHGWYLKMVSEGKTFLPGPAWLIFGWLLVGAESLGKQSRASNSTMCRGCLQKHSPFPKEAGLQKQRANIHFKSKRGR